MRNHQLEQEHLNLESTIDCISTQIEAHLQEITELRKNITAAKATAHTGTITVTSHPGFTDELEKHFAEQAQTDLANIDITTYEKALIEKEGALSILQHQLTHYWNQLHSIQFKLHTAALPQTTPENSEMKAAGNLKKIKQALSEFNHQHPNEQPEEIQLEIYQLSIAIQQATNNPSFCFTPQICASQNRLENTEVPLTQEFITLLWQLLDILHNNSSSIPINPKQLTQINKGELATLSAQLRQREQAALTHLIDRIEKTIENTDKADISFLLTILRRADCLTGNTATIAERQAAVEDCKRFANLLGDKANPYKQVIGTLLIIAGISLVAGSMVAAFLSCGALCPVVAFGVIKTTGLTVGGASSALVGSGLFYYGRRKGASRALVDLVETKRTEDIAVADFYSKNDLSL